MNRIEESHPRSAWLLMASGFFERLGHYGFRSLIVLYMLSETINMEQSEAMYIYAHFTGGYLLFSLLGGVFGDFVLGNRKTSLAGAVSIVVGMFVLLIPSVEGLYAGLILILIGEGLYASNVYALFAKEYLSRKKLMAGGFTGLLFLVNIGAFLAPFLFGGLETQVSYQTGFIVAGGITLLSILFLSLAKLKKPGNEETSPNWEKSRRTLIISFAMLSFIGTAIYMLNTIKHIPGQNMPLLETLNDSGISIYIMENALEFVLLGLGFLIWTYFYSSLFHKMALGFAFTALAFLIYFINGYMAVEGSEALYFLGVLLIAIAEMFTAPLLFSVIGTYANPRYFASLIGLSKVVVLVFLPLTWLLGLLPGSASIGKGIIVLVLVGFSVVSWRLR